MTAWRIPIPLPFALVVSTVIFLLIFFGAWAVSADASSHDRSLSLGFAGDAGLEAAPDPREAYSGVLASGPDDNSWWESALLKTCPFH